ENTVWLGHDRITGSIALAASKQRGGLSALIHHMSYAHYEDFAENSAKAYEKVTEQKSLFAAADRVLAIGPLLKAALEDLTERADVMELVPGLAEITPRSKAPNLFKIFLSGRLSEDARKIKQAHMGLAGFGHAVALCDRTPAFPDALRG